MMLLLLLLPAALLHQGGVDSRRARPRLTAAGYVCVVGLGLGDLVLAGGQDVLAGLGGGGGTCWSRESLRRIVGGGEASTLPGFSGGAALWTLLYDGVQMTLSAVRAFC